MEKIKGALKLDFYKAIKNKIFAIGMILSFIGLAIILRDIYKFEKIISYVLVLKYIPIILTFINFSIIFPLVKLNEKENDIFKSMNLSIREKMISKTLIMLFINLIYFFLIIIFYIIFGIYSNLNLSEIFQYIRPVVLYEILGLLFYNSVSLFFGKLFGKYLNGFFAYLFSVITIFLSSGVFISFREATPLRIYNTSLYCSWLTPIKENEFFWLDYVFWIGLSLIILILYYILELRKVRYIGILSIPLLIMMVFTFKIHFCVKEKLPTKVEYGYGIGYRDYLNNQIVMPMTSKALEGMSPEDYTIIPKTELTNIVDRHESSGEQMKDVVVNYTIMDTEKDQCIIELRDSLPYKVDEYIMDINLQEDFNNKCKMKVIRENNNINKLKFDFFNKSNIKYLTVNGIKSEFSTDGSSLYINIPNEIKENELLIELEYSAYVYTYRGNLQESDFVMDNSGFLSGGLPWYPKLLNNDKEKYTLNVNSKVNTIYSNIDVNKEENSFKITGFDKDVILFYGDLKEIETDKYTLVVPSLLVKKQENIDKLKNLIQNYDLMCKEEKEDYTGFKRVFITPENIFYKNDIYGDVLIMNF